MRRSSCQSLGILMQAYVMGKNPCSAIVWLWEEFSGELSNFIINDARQRHSHVKDYITVTLIEVRPRQYATGQSTKLGVELVLVRGIVKDVQDEKTILDNGDEVPYGLLVLSTGMGPSTFTRQLSFSKSPGGRVGIDEWFESSRLSLWKKEQMVSD